MKTLEMSGRRMVFWGALLLMGWAVYELSVRFEEMVTWLSPVYALVREGKITFWDYLSRVNWHRLRTHLFLIACALLGLYALLVRGRPILSLISVPLAILMGILLLGSTNIMEASIWQKLKLTPLALIALGGLIGFSCACISGRKQNRNIQAQASTSVQPRHYDPFRMKGPPY